MMLEWLGTNLGTISVVLALTGIVVLIVWNLLKSRKKGRHACCGNCAHCAGCPHH